MNKSSDIESYIRTKLNNLSWNTNELRYYSAGVEDTLYSIADIMGIELELYRSDLPKSKQGLKPNKRAIFSSLQSAGEKKVVYSLRSTGGTVYYAHSKRIYNAPREQEELDYLESCFEEVINPNGLDYGDDMRKYYTLIRKADALVLSEYEGCIGRGVFDETKLALKEHIPCFVLRDKKLISVKMVHPWKTNDWGIQYGKVEIRK